MMVVTERGHPEGQGQSEEEVEVREKEGTRITRVQERSEGRVQAFSPWPHLEISQ